jgi:hypothetical protein
MPLSLPIPEFKVVRCQPKITAFARVVPAPKIFALPITWQETATPPQPVRVIGTAFHQLPGGDANTVPTQSNY